MSMSEKRARCELSKPGRFMMVTYRYSGPVYSMDDGRAITRKAGEKMAGMIPMLEMPDMLTPNEDGLFPGMSQTWVAQ